MAPTIRDVASRANVSFQLAAAVLGRKKYARASARTKEKIFAAAEALGYVPNVSARILRGDPSRIIGVLIDSQAPESTHSLLAEIEQAADKLGYRILSAQAHDDPEKLLSAYRSLKQNGVDGILSLSHDYAQLNFHLDDRLKNDPKIVFVLNAPAETGSSVDVDSLGGMKSVRSHFRRNGYSKTALLLREPDPEKLTRSIANRLEGFRECFPEGQVLFLKSAVDDFRGLEKECLHLIRKRVITGHVDSVIAQNDGLAILLMRALLSRGIRIPQDFGLVGFDDLPVDACLPITLSSLYYDQKEMAEAALGILMDKIAGKTEPVRIICRMKLVSRESSRKKEMKDER